MKNLWFCVFRSVLILMNIAQQDKDIKVWIPEGETLLQMIINYCRAGNQQCGHNEQYVNCVSFCNTCWEMNNCRPSFCEPGCDCRPGFYRDYYGQCITERQCYASLYGLQNTCGENEEYSHCINPCNDCQSKGLCSYQYNCESGCDCRRGFFRNERGVCVPQQHCYRQECAENEIFLDCGPSCRSTCSNFRQIIYERCQRDCVPGCHCRGNFVLGPDGKCTRPEFCPPVRRDPHCPPSEVYYQCLPTCRTTCRSLNSTEGICSAACQPGCFCQPGFVRHDNGTCVRPENCNPPPRPTCGVGEVFYDCLPCPTTCEALNSTIPCTRICRPGCACARGLLKRQDGLCVRPQNCELVCDENEEYLTCGPACPPTCSNLNSTLPCTERCARGCFCTNGFVFGPFGTCIPPSSCPNIPCPTPEPVGIGGRRSGTDDEVPSTTAPTTETTHTGTAPDTTAAADPTVTTSSKSDPTSPKTTSATTLQDSTTTRMPVTLLSDITTSPDTTSISTPAPSTQTQGSQVPTSTGPTNQPSTKTEPTTTVLVTATSVTTSNSTFP